MERDEQAQNVGSGSTVEIEKTHKTAPAPLTLLKLLCGGIPGRGSIYTA